MHRSVRDYVRASTHVSRGLAANHRQLWFGANGSFSQSFVPLAYARLQENRVLMAPCPDLSVGQRRTSSPGSCGIRGVPGSVESGGYRFHKVAASSNPTLTATRCTDGSTYKWHCTEPFTRESYSLSTRVIRLRNLMSRPSALDMPRHNPGLLCMRPPSAKTVVAVT